MGDRKFVGESFGAMTGPFGWRIQCLLGGNLNRRPDGLRLLFVGARIFDLDQMQRLFDFL